MNKSVLLLLQRPWGDEMKQASARKNRVLKSVVANMSCMYIYLMLSVMGGVRKKSLYACSKLSVFASNE